MNLFVSLPIEKAQTMTNYSNRHVCRTQRNLLHDESGFIVSAELILILTMFICAVAVGFGVVKDAIATELNDISDAIGAVDQSYTFSGHQAPTGTDGVFHGTCAAFGFQDAEDECDCQVITIIAATPKVDASGGSAENQ